MFYSMLVLFVLLFNLLLSPQVAATSTATPAPTVTRVATRTATPVPTATAAATVTRVPTRTATPRSTSTPTINLCHYVVIEGPDKGVTFDAPIRTDIAPDCPTEVWYATTGKPGKWKARLTGKN